MYISDMHIHCCHCMNSISCVYIYVYIYIYICMCMCIHIYIYDCAPRISKPCLPEENCYMTLRFPCLHLQPSFCMNVLSWLARTPTTTLCPAI